MTRLRHFLICIGCIALIVLSLPGRAPAEEGAISHVLYVYLPACESCGKAEEAIDALSGAALQTADGAPVTVEVERLNLAEHPQDVEALFERYGVPEDDRIAPIVFAGEGYLSGFKAIRDGLEALAVAAAEAGEPALDAEPDAEAVGETGEAAAEAAPATDAVGWTATVAAGLVAGLNPCAISMLLLFLATFVGRRRYTVAFLASKFVVYLLLGTLLNRLFLRLAAPALPGLAKWLLTVFGGALALLNLWDAAEAFWGRYGNVRNQLPSRLRGWLHARIRSAGGARWLLAASVALGALVAVGEFMCAGQVYLATLLSAVRTGMGFELLLVYCAAFILPAALIALAVDLGKSRLRVSGWMAAHMPQVKLLTAAAMLGLILLAWLR